MTFIKSNLVLFVLISNQIVVSCKPISKSNVFAFDIPTTSPRESWWTAFGGDEAHTGFKAEQLGDVSSLRLLWNVTKSYPFKAPVVFNERVFVMSSTGVLSAFDEETGQLVKLWNYGSGSSIGPPTIGYDGLLFVQYVGTEEGIFVFAVDVDTLKVKWVATGKAQTFKYPYGVVASDKNNMMYFAGGEYSEKLYGVNTSAGQSVFAMTLPNFSSFGSDRWAPALYNNRLFYCSGVGGGGSSKSIIGEADPLTGQSLWFQDLYSAGLIYEARFLPVIANDVALAVVFADSSTASILAINISAASTPEAIWTTDTCQLITSYTDWEASPATDGKWAFFPCADGIQAFDLFTGAPTMKYVPCNECAGQPIVTADFVIAKSSTGIRVYNKLTGNQVKGAFTNESVENAAFHDGRLFITSGSSLLAYELV